MKIQNVPGIYVYYTELYSKQEKCYYFNSIRAVADIMTGEMIEKLIVNYPEDIYREVYNVYSNDEYRHLLYYRISALAFKFYYVCDENGKLIPKDVLIGEHRKAVEERRKRFSNSWSYCANGRKRKAWGHHYAISCVRTRRNDVVDVDAEELDIDVKYRRKAVTPDSWDLEKQSHNEKCWKKQRKVRHQWERK